MTCLDIISDSTGKEIVAAIKSTDVAQARISEINQAAESKKNEVLASIPEDYNSVVNEVNQIKGDLDDFKTNQPNLFMHRGANILDESLLVDGKRLISSGEISDLANSCATESFIDISDIKDSHIGAYFTDSNGKPIRCFYRMSFYSVADIGGHLKTYSNSNTIDMSFAIVEIPNGANFVRVSYATLTTNFNHFMLISGNSDMKLINYEKWYKKITVIPEDLIERLDRADNICGVARFKNSEDPSFPIKYGDVTSVLSHFKLGMVKDGKLMYWVNQADIYKQEDGLYDSVLSGEDGDILSVNDCDIYYLITGDDTYDIMLYSLAPFVFNGIQSNHIRPRGVAPCACYIDNINNANEINNYYEILKDGKSHCTISGNEAYIGNMQHIKGIYNESGIYNASDSLISDGINMPTVFTNLRVAEKGAMNKGNSYTNYDMLSVEIMLSMMFAEYGTRYICSKKLFGMCNSNLSPNEALFDNGDSDALDGMRFKDENNQWVYMNYVKDYSGDIGNLTTSNGTPISIITMPTNYTSPWKMLEQHSVMSYAYRNNIEAGEWFYYCGREYKYKNVGNGNFIRDGIMSCVVFKKFKTKLDGVFHNSVDISGNDAEFIIISSLYRGMVIDALPHYWVTGIKAVLCSDKPLHYFFYGSRNYKKYLVDRTYEAKTLNEVYDFEKEYNYLGEFYSTGGTTEIKLHDKSILIPTVRGGDGKSTYDCLAIQTDKKVANSDIDKSHFIDDTTENTKIVTGVKWGYLGGLNKLFIQHPESYNVALAGYTKFVCQEVEI